MMCEYCKNTVNPKLPNKINNRKASIRIFLDGKPHMDVSPSDTQITRFYYVEINYCPMCGRKLDDAQNGGK